MTLRPRIQTLSTLACAGLLLAACATPGSYTSQAKVAPYRETIDLGGRLSVNYQKDGNPETISVKFAWAQVPGRIDLDLATPLGQTVARISVTPGSATLTQANQAPRAAADIDSLTRQTLGWSLPVAGLRDWVQGYATDASGARFAASPVRHSVTTDDGWRLRFVSWQDPDAARPVPRRIDAERSATASADALAIRIVLDPQP
ncbi:outer membrane lipoprotein LolB [Massilia glaciei]|nr:outer membrane lipoprotein LolB [Massilia glaciei]